MTEAVQLIDVIIWPVVICFIGWLAFERGR